MPSLRPNIALSDTAACLAQRSLYLLRKLPLQTVMLTDPVGRRQITVAKLTLHGRNLRADVVTGTLYDQRGRCLTSDVLRIGVKRGQGNTIRPKGRGNKAEQ